MRFKLVLPSRVTCLWSGAVALTLAAGAMLSAGCSVAYIASLGYYQGKLLWGREPVEKVLLRPDVSPDIKAKLRFVQEVRAYGEGQLHLSPTQNYSTINLSWDHEIWNVTACQELAFAPHTWWFPIVGTVPYKGFFKKEQGESEEQLLKARGYDTALRRVGGYSTLGWFKDPILPHMLEYEPPDLANLVFHELAHATLFIRGSVDFNESFASFVADEATLRFLADRDGAESEPLLETRRRYADADRFTSFMHALYEELNGVYQSADSDQDKRTRKQEVLSEAASRFAALPFESARYGRRKLGAMNNADVLQYRRYSSAQRQFAAVLAHVQGDMSRFFALFAEIDARREEPFAALTRLAGAAAETAGAEHDTAR